ncbi:MAG: adenosylcobinamide-phosphate synthase CbiB, partial [Beijerinckiaceae bacterium]
VSANALWILSLALVLDAIIGDPDAIWRRWPHPVVWFGKVIGWLDRSLNRESDSFGRRRTLGVIALGIALLFFSGISVQIHYILAAIPLGWVIEALLASVLIAQKSLWQHVARVAAGLEKGGLQGGREAVSMIVGRDPLSLDEAGVARAAIESTAENFSDGVVAPAFWFALLGLPGIVAYKVVNTADSMIGHMSERHRAFGWAAARLDDLVNLIPARLSGLLIALAAPIASGSIGQSLGVMRRNAGLHRSPNAGWPEAAMAGALGLALAGPRRYGERVVDDPFLNPAGRREATAADIRRALKVMAGAAALLAFAVFVGAGAGLVLN